MSDGAFGSAVRKARKRMGMTQSVLARLVGTSQQVIASIETGVSQRTRLLPEICQVLELDVYQFTEGVADPEEKPEKRVLTLTEQEVEQIRASLIQTLETIMKYHEATNQPLLLTRDTVPGFTDAIMHSISQSLKQSRAGGKTWPHDENTNGFVD